ncbi:MAG: YidC/Oxa1 family membrane protein insertase [Lachnospiraceae bacterium]|nr:YidC/Oxa1 family membrane protein insertase [Lachnospiraceae bacterium]MEE1249206.1 YidC/Oxa1 family membrane protein insertase [Lachnospiraceae bacterium]
MSIILTKSTMPIVGWIADILGLLMNGIFYVLNSIGIPNVGLSIILFTIIMYALMTPLQIKQQKFSKLTAVMNPELQKIQKKYANKKDQASMTKMQEETQAVYAKYGVSPTGSCLQMLITLPVMFALYQVIYHIPGYINVIGNELTTLAESAGFVSFFTTFVEGLENGSSLQLNAETTAGVVDAIYKLNPTQWTELLTASAGESFHAVATSTYESLMEWTNFLGLYISYSPWNIIKAAWEAKQWLMLIGSVLVPVLAWFTQWLNYKLMPQASGNNQNGDNSMEATMKSMNTMMPLMSAVFCLTLPVGIGIYWIIGAVVRSVQQLVINRHMDKINIDEMIKQNIEKANKKREKQGLPPQKITNQAKMNVRNLEVDQDAKQKQAQSAAQKRQESTAYYNSANAKPGSLAAKANMVKQFDERNSKKK